MAIKRMTLLLVFLSSGILNAAHPIVGIDEAYGRGEISIDEMILNKVYSFLNPDLLDPRFQVDEQEPLKCGTPVLVEYEQLQSQLQEATINTIEELLLPQLSGLRETYFSDGGHFAFTYVTTGSNGVPATDSDSNGVPDFVEWAGDYLDFTWAQEVDSAGFAGPNHVGGDGFYNVSFEN